LRNSLVITRDFDTNFRRVFIYATSLAEDYVTGIVYAGFRYCVSAYNHEKSLVTTHTATLHSFATRFDSYRFNQSIKVFWEWPKWHCHCKVHCRCKCQ